MATTLEVRSALELAIKKAGVEIRSEARLSAREAIEDGAFDPMEGYGSPRIIIRRDVWNIAGDPLHETLILAHEFGHFISYASGRPAAYAGAVAAFNREEPLDPLQQRLVLDEEIKAWNEARAVLASVGFEDWSAFSRREADSLAAYRTMLGSAS